MTRVRRAAAWLIDTAPLWFAALLVVPFGLLYSQLRLEEAQAIGMFDPSDTGGYIVEMQLSRALDRWRMVAVLLAVVWLAVEIVIIAVARRSVGKAALALRPVSLSDGGRPSAGVSPARALLRELPRLALLALVPVVHALLVLPRARAAPGWEAYAPGPLAPPEAGASIWVTLMALNLPAALTIGIALCEVALVLGDASARTLVDRIARTRVEREVV